MNTIRLFANGGFIERLDDEVKNILKDKFDVNPSRDILNTEVCIKTNYGLIYLNSKHWLSDRESGDEWIQRLIHPAIDCCLFAYIIINTYPGRKNFITPIVNTKIIYIDDWSITYLEPELIDVLKSLSF
jgi:hypothetical protein